MLNHFEGIHDDMMIFAVLWPSYQIVWLYKVMQPIKTRQPFYITNFFQLSSYRNEVIAVSAAALNSAKDDFAFKG